MEGLWLNLLKYNYSVFIWADEKLKKIICIIYTEEYRIIDCKKKLENYHPVLPFVIRFNNNFRHPAGSDKIK